MVERGPEEAGKLLGILTNRDVRFADDPRQPVDRADDPQGDHGAARGSATTRRAGCCTSTGSRSCSSSTMPYRCVGLITVKDIEKATRIRTRPRIPTGRLRVAAATTVGDEGFERAETLMAAGVDCLVVDTAHGHSERCSTQVDASSARSNKVADHRRQRRDRARARRR